MHTDTWVDRGAGNKMGTLQILHTVLVNMVSEHLWPSVQPQFFLEWTRTSFEQSLAEFYNILLKEHLHVALEMLEVGNCSSL
jgi:hypothetical protein